MSTATAAVAGDAQVQWALDNALQLETTVSVLAFTAVVVLSFGVFFSIAGEDLLTDF